MAATDLETVGAAPNAGVTALGSAAEEVAARVRTSVAEVRTRGAGTGAGTIWRRDGMVVTNHHVVARDRAEVVLADGRAFAATVRARDPRNDLAVLQVDARDLPAAPVGDARRLRPGELVLAVGHPFGVTGALTIGVVHQALPARGYQYGEQGQRELVQADVLLGPGNSGGPLVDAVGRVVGINAMVYGGLALAVPSHLASRLVAHPEGPPVLGVAVQAARLAPAQQAAATEAGLGSGHNVLVLGVEEDSAAESAGVLPGDVLLSLGGLRLDTLDALPEALAATAGTPAPLVVLRGTRLVHLTTTPRRRK